MLGSEYITVIYNFTCRLSHLSITECQCSIQKFTTPMTHPLNKPPDHGPLSQLIARINHLHGLLQNLPESLLLNPRPSNYQGFGLDTEAIAEEVVWYELELQDASVAGIVETYEFMSSAIGCELIKKVHHGWPYTEPRFQKLIYWSVLGVMWSKEMEPISTMSHK